MQKRSFLGLLLNAVIRRFLGFFIDEQKRPPKINFLAPPGSLQEGLGKPREAMACCMLLHVLHGMCYTAAACAAACAAAACCAAQPFFLVQAAH